MRQGKKYGRDLEALVVIQMRADCDLDNDGAAERWMGSRYILQLDPI